MKRFNTNQVKFNFEVIPAQASDSTKQNLVKRVHQGDLEGFIVKGIFSPEEVESFKKLTAEIPADRFLKTNTGTILPDPFATISDLDERARNYVEKNKAFQTFGFERFHAALQNAMELVAGDYRVQVPATVLDNYPAVAATVRHFYPGMGGLYVHCGYLFQEQSPKYYQAVEPMKKEGQLSFFVVIQQPEQGGELTLYDMVWENVNAKDFPENNEFVLDRDGNRIYLTEVNQVKYNPQPGDMLIFYGGRIWHRVEPIVGALPRITFGGFINFSEDDQTMFYWS